MNVWEVSNGCGGWGEKRANGQKKDEGIGQSELGKMGMGGGQMQVIAQLGIRVELGESTVRYTKMNLINIVFSRNEI